MYGIAGERRLNEREPSWLPGYEASEPVRIGNAAYNQRQIDVLGEVMDALYQGRRGGLPALEAGWALHRWPLTLRASGASRTKESWRFGGGGTSPTSR